MPTKRPRRERRRRRVWRWIVAGGVLFVGAIAGLAGWITYREVSANLPPVESLVNYDLPVATRVYADDGALLGEFYTEKRYLVPIAQIPRVVRQAFIAAEDAGFYRHRGVDFLGITRAALANVKAGEVVQGGSTITQQVVKALLLTPEKSYERKAKEVLLAIRLERQLTKDEILYLYLNLIYLGSGAYGVGAAAEQYFGVHVSELGLPEAALLAGLPQAPSRYSPFRHWERAKQRQRYVLQRMAREGLISWDEAERALNAPIQLAHRAARPPTYRAAPYFVEHVRRFLEDRYGGTALYQAGLHVHTTVNLPMQEAAETSLRSHLDEIDQGRTRGRALRRLSRNEAARFLAAARTAKDDDQPEPGRSYRALVLEAAPAGGFRIQVNRFTGRLIATDTTPLPSGLGPNDLVAVRRLPGGADDLRFALDTDPQVEGALVSIDLATGHVKTLVGGYDFRRSQFNRATQALRQPGSAFKPFVFAAALDRSYTPASVIVDEPIALPGFREVWMPKNYDKRFIGPTTLRRALMLSRNVVSVKLAQNVGLNYLVDYLPRFGFERQFARNMSISLGSSEVTLFELTRAYAVFANQGRLPEARFITKITDPHGKVLEEFPPASEPVISAETAYLITSMLKSVVEDGTGRRVRPLGRPAAGKTGTTNNIHDAWFIGYTPDLVTGVWVGYDSERSLGRKQTGGRVAAPIFLTFMEAALGDRPVRDFPVPDGITCVPVYVGSAGGDSTDDGSIVECFKKGSEPRRDAVEDDLYFDELDRAVGRLRSVRIQSRGADDPFAPDDPYGADPDYDRFEPEYDRLAPDRDPYAADPDPFAPDPDPFARDPDSLRRDRRPARDGPRGYRVNEPVAPRAEDYLPGRGGTGRPGTRDWQRGTDRRERRRPIVEEPLY